MDLRTFNLNALPIHDAIESVMERLAEATDNDDRLLLNSVDHAYGKPPTERDMPAVRVRYKLGYDVKSAQHHTQEHTADVTLLFYHYLTPGDEGVSDFHELRNRHINQTLLSLELPDETTPNNFTPDRWWWFADPQLMEQSDEQLAERERTTFKVPENIHVTAVKLIIRSKYNTN